MQDKPRVNVYVDSFNLYFGLLKDQHGCRWLSLTSLSQTLCGQLPQLRQDMAPRIQSIYFFTAHVRATNEDPKKNNRQRVYLRALKHDGVRVIVGYFSRNRRKMRAVDSKRSVRVWHTEEKGSDVNLATQMVRDAAKDEMDAAILISNDGDFKAAVACVRQDFQKDVYVVALVNNRQPTRGLKEAASGILKLSRPLVRRHQFPETIPGTTIRKPPSW